MIDVRDPVPEDWEAVSQLLEQTPDAFTAEGRRCFLADGKRFDALLARQDELICGVLVWVSLAAETELLWLAVRPSHRRRGVATVLLNAVENRCRGQQVLLAKTADPATLPSKTRLSADTFAGTVAFFRARGFDVAARIPDYWKRGNASLLLVKRLWTDDGGSAP